MKATDICSITKMVTKKWTTQRKREERSAGAVRYRREYIYRERKPSLIEATWDCLPEVYLVVSDNSRLPAYARQLYYRCRPIVEEKAGRALKYNYFSQVLLPQLQARHPTETDDWWITYDARGTLREPHGKVKVPLGTIEVDKYLRSVDTHKVEDLDVQSAFSTSYPTSGARNRFSAILFVEKQGFDPLFEAVKLAERYDIAIMSCKGQSVVAARRIVDELCGLGGGVPVLVMHDFDREGLLICQRLTSVSWEAEEAGRVRYAFQNEIDAVDLGLRLEDIEKWNLSPEAVHFKGGFPSDTIATDEEQSFLESGKRVELNAFTSTDLVAWIEAKLQEHGIKKVVPDKATLDHAFRRAYHIAHVNKGLRPLHGEAAVKASEIKVPKTLARSVRSQLKDDPNHPWDKVIARLAKEATTKKQPATKVKKRTRRKDS